MVYLYTWQRDVFVMPCFMIIFLGFIFYCWETNKFKSSFKGQYILSKARGSIGAKLKHRKCHLLSASFCQIVHYTAKEDMVFDLHKLSAQNG